MTLYLRRRAQFSAAIAKPSPGGHNYVCELTVGGEIDPRTGMVVNIRAVDAVLKSRVVRPLGGRLLEREVGAFREIPPTAENLARFIWDECASALPSEGKLARVTLWETPTLWAELSVLELQEKTLMLTVTRAYDFSASHRLHSQYLSAEENFDIFGKCNGINGHGHNYDVEVTVAGDPDPRTGQILAPAVLDKLVDEEVLKPFDHKHLNLDTIEFRDLNPTSEMLTKIIWDKLARRFNAEETGGARLYKVVVRETARNYFEYFGEQPLGMR